MPTMMRKEKNTGQIGGRPSRGILQPRDDTLVGMGQEPASTFGIAIS